MNPADPWAWAGLAGDAIDLIPFVTGVGEITRGVKITVKAVDNVDNVVDAAKMAYKTADATSDIRKATGSYEILYKSGYNYVGKGGFQRAITSATQHAKDYGDEVAAIMWKPATNGVDAFIDEYMLMRKRGVGLEDMMKWNYTNSKYVDGLMYVPVTFPYNRPDALLIEDFQIEKTIEVLNQKGLKKVYIQGVEDFTFLKDCCGLEHLKIELHLPFCKWNSNAMIRGKIHQNYELDILYGLPNLKSLQLIDSEDPAVVISKASICLNRLPSLEYFRGEAKFVEGLKEAKNLKLLGLTGYKQKSLSEIGYLKKLETLSLFKGKVETLDGCENLEKLQCLYLSYNRAMHDISALRNLKHSLKLLRIDHCAKIQDFSVLEELENLELLHLDGSQTLPDLDFLNRMPNLKTFICHMNIADGNLTPCLRLSYAYLGKNQKHYNYSDEELPKIKYIRGNEGIEEWRRIE